MKAFTYKRRGKQTEEKNQVGRCTELHIDPLDTCPDRYEQQMAVADLQVRMPKVGWRRALSVDNPSRCEGAEGGPSVTPVHTLLTDAMGGSAAEQ